MIATSATTNSIIVDNTHLLSQTGRETRKSETIAACLPADGLALCALALVTGREFRSVMTTGPPAIAGGYSPISSDLTPPVLLVSESLHPGRRIQSTARRFLLPAQAGLDAPHGAILRRAEAGDNDLAKAVGPGPSLPLQDGQVRFDVAPFGIGKIRCVRFSYVC